MEFREQEAIYKQIVRYFEENILKNKWSTDEKVLSVRSLAIELEVNPNTIMRAYSLLQDNEILYNKRGIGFFVCPDAKHNIIKERRNKFINQKLPELFKEMHLINFSFDELSTFYKKFKNN